MNRCHTLSLLTAALAAALPLHARALDTAADRSPTELDAVRVQAKQPGARDTQSNSFGSGDWKNTPASISVLDRGLLDRRVVRTLSELADNDASLGDSYAPVGYYQNIAIRGFALDTATGYRFNGLTIAGEQRLALENVQQVEILKGEAGLAAGVIAPGGVINYVGKRPAEVRNVTLGTDAKGSRYAAVDVGHWLTPRIGVRFNAAWDDSHSYIDHADGRRNFYALATDWLIGERAKLEVDANYQTSAQRSASGYQLLGASMLPQHVDRTQMLGYQRWQQPVGIDSTNLSVLHTYDFSPAWQSRVSASHSRSVIDDNVAFAYGCYYAEACWDGSVPGNYFAPNGDYDIYDYRSPDDTRSCAPNCAAASPPARSGTSWCSAPTTSAARWTSAATSTNTSAPATSTTTRCRSSTPRRCSRAHRCDAWTAARRRCSCWTACSWPTTGNGWPAAASCAWTSAPGTSAATPNATAAYRASCRRPR